MTSDTSIWKRGRCSRWKTPSDRPLPKRPPPLNHLISVHPVKRKRAMLESNSPRDSRRDSSRTMSRGAHAPLSFSLSLGEINHIGPIDRPCLENSYHPPTTSRAHQCTSAQTAN